MNKPVAWINGNEICPEIGYEATITAEHPKDLGWIPLYTHPVKELTDDEIIDLINKHIDYVPDEDNGMKLVGVMDFAKAILRKAQEK